MSVQSASGVQSGGASASTGDAGIVASSVASSRSAFAAGLRLVTVTASSALADFDLDREAPAENTAAVCVAGEGGAGASASTSIALVDAGPAPPEPAEGGSIDATAAGFAWSASPRLGRRSRPRTGSRGRTVLPSSCACFTRCCTCVESLGSAVSSATARGFRARRSEGTLGANRVRRPVGAAASAAPSPPDPEGSPASGDAMASTMPRRRPGRRGPSFPSPCIA